MNHKEINVLILCTYPSTYVVQLYKNIKKYYPNIKYSIFTQDNSKDFFLKSLNFNDDEKLYSFGNHEYLCLIEASKLPKFDIIHSLWMEHFWGEAATILREKCDYWFASVGGSDLYRDSNKLLHKILQKRIIARADLISSENWETKERFYHVYGKKYRNIKHEIVRFGVDILDEIDVLSNDTLDVKALKEKYHIPEDKIVIMCGTNARQQHQHIIMLERLSTLPQYIISNICLLIPMTYDGTEEYISGVESKARSLFENVVVLKEFLNTREMAEITIVTDIMIHVQTTDQLSSIMIAQMYNGNIVVAGEWLPYNSLKERNVYFLGVENIDSLADCVEKVIEEMDINKNRCKLNRNIIKDFSSWEKSAEKWYNAYIDLIERR